MGNLGTPEILLILLVILVLFGAKKIPDLMQGLGKGVKEFRKASRDIQNEIEHEVSGTPTESKTTCFYCSSPVAREARFCPSCGKSLEAPRCAKCSAVNPLGSKFCKECGEKIAA
ncbi:MAG: twin-arginine translocase TatA/TatE family subunit [Bacteroidota bacterium]